MGTPMVGETYRQEWSSGNAKDVGTVISTSYNFDNDPELALFVPVQLVNLLCADSDCVVTVDLTLSWKLNYLVRDRGLKIGGFIHVSIAIHKKMRSERLRKA